MKRWIVLVLLSQTFAISSFAKAIVVVNGKLVSFNSKHYVVEREKLLYYIKKEAIRAELAQGLERPEIQVSLPVPLEGIDKITPKSSGY